MPPRVKRADSKGFIGHTNKSQPVPVRHCWTVSYALPRFHTHSYWYWYFGILVASFHILQLKYFRNQNRSCWTQNTKHSWFTELRSRSRHSSLGSKREAVQWEQTEIDCSFWKYRVQETVITGRIHKVCAIPKLVDSSLAAQYTIWAYAINDYSHNKQRGNSKMKST